MKTLKIQTFTKKNLLGFTLVELIVVITILVILGTIAFTSLTGYSSNARDSDRVTTLKNIESGLDIHRIKSGSYPAPENIIGTGVINSTILSSVGTIGDTISRIIRINKTPIDPLTKTNYTYGTDAQKTQYQIATTLENPVAYHLSPLVQTVYADTSLQARVNGNYPGYIKYSSGTQTYIANIPSLLFNNTGSTNLLSTGTYFVVNKQPNLPYKIDDKTQTQNKNANEIIQAITSTQTATLTGARIDNITTSTGISALFTGTLLASFWWDIAKMETVVLGESTTVVTSGSSDVNGSCTGLPSNTLYTNSTTSYSLANAPSGTTLSAVTAGYNTSPTSNTCQWKCGTGYGWNGSTCIASPQTLSACTAPSGVSNYVFYNNTTSYSPQSAWNGSTWSLWTSSSVGTTPVTPATPATTPAVNTCEWKCGTGYSWNGSSCTVSPTFPVAGITLTSCGAYGRYGPSNIGSCSYSWSTTSGGTVTMSSTQGFQLWTVPTTGQYTFEVVGAGSQGPRSSNSARSTRIGGKGAKVTGTFNLNAGNQILITVGQYGYDYYAGGGGGGTFVALGNDKNTATPMIIAGGGWGHAANGDTGNPDATWIPLGSEVNNCTPSYAGACGGGFILQVSDTYVGQSFRNGLVWGGSSSYISCNDGTSHDTTNDMCQYGWFWGGGGTDASCSGGGGGGWYGSATSGDDSCWGRWAGGGSYNGWTNQSYQGWFNNINGWVKITKN